MFGCLGLFLLYPVWVMLNGAFSDVDCFSLQCSSILLSSPHIREACISSFPIVLAATVFAFLPALLMALTGLALPFGYMVALDVGPYFPHRTAVAFLHLRSGGIGDAHPDHQSPDRFRMYG